MLIEFDLEPLEAIEPWRTEEATPVLSWFALTSGHYAINLGGPRLFAYDAAYRAVTGAPDRVAYQVVRLLEDLFDCAPGALEQAPPAIVRFAAANPDVLLAEAIRRRGQTRREVNTWFDARRLSSSHLGESAPQVHAWTDGADVVVEWEATARSNGARVWSIAERGRARIPLGEFVQALESFHRDLLDRMRARIDAIAAGARSDVHIDLPGLERDQKAWARAMTDFHATARVRSPRPEDEAAFAALLAV